MRISVITPTYNRPELLKETIKSFIAQDYENKEMIIVNDASTVDGYLEINKITMQCDNIFYCSSLENKGCPSSINRGIKEISSGDLICIIADDDLLVEPDSLSKRVQGFDNDTEVLYTGFYTIDHAGNQMSRAYPIEPDKDLIWQKDYINIQSMMWRRSVHDKIGYFSEDLINNEDWEWKIKCLMECNVKAIGDLTVKSRYHGNNKSIVNRAETNKCAEILIKRMKERYL